MDSIPILQNRITIPYLLFLYEQKEATKSEILNGIGVSPSTATLYHKILQRSGLIEVKPQDKKKFMLSKKGIQLCRTLLTCGDICKEAEEIFKESNIELYNKLDKEIQRKEKRISDSKKTVLKLKNVLE